MGISRFGGALLGAGALLSLSAGATAAMSNSASTYGILPSDIASAQALSLFTSQASAVYYNPASLTNDPRGELTGAIFHAEHDLKSNGNTIMNTPSQQLQLGLKTDLSSMSTIDHPLYLAVMLGAEKYTQELMAFSSETSEDGQYLRYGRQPLFFTVGVGTNIWRGIDFGVAFRLMLHADATLNTRSTLGGDTSHESLHVSAKPVLRSIFGLNINWGETFCGRADCWADKLEMSLAYRSSADARTKVDSNVTVPGTIPDPGLNLNIFTIDGYHPETTSLGFLYDFGRTRLGVTGEYQAWSHLEHSLRGDTINGAGDVRLQDTIIPRVGVDVALNDHLTFTSGVAFEESPLLSTRNPDVNYLDADRWVVGLGLTAEIPPLPFMAYPVRLDFGYQYHRIEKRTFELESSHPSTPPGVHGTAETKGDVQVFGGSLSLKF